MTTTAIHPPRRIEDICPPWCEGHSGGHQGWETSTVDGRQWRHHDDHGRRIANASVFVGQVEREDHTLEAANVTLYTDGVGNFDVTELTPAQARELAQILIEAANQAEARA